MVFSQHIIISKNYIFLRDGEFCHLNFHLLSPITLNYVCICKTYLNLGESVKPGAVDRVTVGYRTSRTKYTVTFAIGIPQEFSHFFQDRLLHDGHYRCHFERIYARI